MVSETSVHGEAGARAGGIRRANEIVRSSSTLCAAHANDAPRPFMCPVRRPTTQQARIVAGCRL
eukprot:3659963-Prymnesium_polylepis.1